MTAQSNFSLLLSKPHICLIYLNEANSWRLFLDKDFYKKLLTDSIH